MITKEEISENLLSYLQHKITLAQLIQRSEDALMNNNFEDDNKHTIRNILAKIGSADVKNFSLTWEDCEEIMNRLGFKLQVLAKADN